MSQLEKEEIIMDALINNFSALLQKTKSKLNRIVSNKANEETYQKFYQMSKRDKRDIEIKLDEMKSIVNNIKYLHKMMYKDFQRKNVIYE